MPINVNEFFKGDNRDIDVLKMPNDTTRRLQNMRVLDVDGKGLVLTNIGGNEEKFRISPGFIPLGNCEYNGVGYIASVNPDTGQGELGCYPAPLALVNEDVNGSGWNQADKQYAPLFNFTASSTPRDPASASGRFTTPLFGFKCENQIDMFAREDYDGSVNLYLAQKELPIRVFNSGFDQNGELTSIGRRYWNNSFPNAVNMLHEAEIHPDVDFLGLGKAGNLRGGNWHFFARYATENFDKTSFFTETNAIQITEGDFTSEGFSHSGVIGGQETDKSINLRYSNLDPTYAYLEIGYMYSFNDTQEFGIIDKLYAIDPNVATIDIEITGFEGTFNIGFEELIKTKPKYDGAWTHTQLENRYFAANLFDTAELDSEAIKQLLEFSRKITCQYDDTKTIPHTAGGLNYLGIYNNPFNVYNFTGHFRGEAYPYGVVFVLDNGRETQAFPCTGSDDYSGGSAGTNANGIYRFPNVNASPTVVGNNISVMGIKFDISAAVTSLPSFIADHVVGFYFVRGKRNATLLYQGVSLPCYNASEGQDIRNIWFLFPDKPQTLRRNENYVPMFERFGNQSYGATFPYIKRFDQSLLFNNEFTFVAEHRDLTKKIRDKWGFYSPDHFFNKSLGIKKSYILPYAEVTWSIADASNLAKGDYHYNDIGYSFLNQFKSIADVSNIKEWEPANNNGFCSYFNEGAKEDFNSMLYFFVQDLANTKYQEVRNSEIAWNSYIGINSTLSLRYKMINMYSSRPDDPGFDITDLYDIKATQYYKISKFYKLSDVVANNGIVNDKVHYKGDCFLQRTWLKQLFNPKYGVGVTDDGGGADTVWTNPLLFPIQERHFTFGTTFSVITENTVNTEMRLENFTNKYYPGNYSNVREFATRDIEKESTDLNRGYNQILSVKSYTGIDEEIPFFPENKPAGIMFSNLHILGAFLDGYRVIDQSALKEYDYRMGGIVSIRVLNNVLISVQEGGINRHFVNEKAVLNQGNSAGELLLGTGDILDKKHHNLTDFVGSQHQWSIVVTDMSIYGVDYNKRKIWRVLPNLNVDLISDTKGYRKTLHELCERNSHESDITEDLLDNPVCRQGIVGFYDRKHNDVYFTWIYGDPKPEREEDCEHLPYDRDAASIVFNEWMDAFHGERTFVSPMYMAIGEDFFSFNPDIFPSTAVLTTGFGDAWLQDIKEIDGVENSTCFYGSDDPDIAFVEFIVNNPQDITKVFDCLQISSSPHDLYKAVYETQHQISEHFPWIVGDQANYWRDPSYTENLWGISIIRTQETQEPVNNIYDVDSRFRGRWLKIRLEWNTKSGIFIKSVLTQFRESKS